MRSFFFLSVGAISWSCDTEYPPVTLEEALSEFVHLESPPLIAERCGEKTLYRLEAGSFVAGGGQEFALPVPQPDFSEVVNFPVSFNIEGFTLDPECGGVPLARVSFLEGGRAVHTSVQNANEYCIGGGPLYFADPESRCNVKLVGPREEWLDAVDRRRGE